MDAVEGSPMSNLMLACGGVLKLRAGVKALLLPSLEGERAQVAMYLQWAQDQGNLAFKVCFKTRMPRYRVRELPWRDCSSLNQLPWKLPTRGMSLRYAGVQYVLIDINNYLVLGLSKIMCMMMGWVCGRSSASVTG